MDDQNKTTEGDTQVVKSLAVRLDRIAVVVRTGDVIEEFPFRTKQQADKKILELIKTGYSFDSDLALARVTRPQPGQEATK